MNILEEYGYIHAENTHIKNTTPNGTIPARVVAIHRNLYNVVFEHGEVKASLKGAFLHEATFQTVTTKRNRAAPFYQHSPVVTYRKRTGMTISLRKENHLL